MFALILLEISTFVMFVVILISTFDMDKGTDKNEKDFMFSMLFTLANLILEAVSVGIIVVYGIHSLYFKVVKRLDWYIVRYIIKINLVLSCYQLLFGRSTCLINF
jgi:hypothetical protein